MYSPGSRADNPLGTKFDVNRNILSLRSFVTSVKTISLKSDFIKKKMYISDFIHVYSLGAGTDSPLGTKLLCPQKRLITLFFCYKVQKQFFRVCSYTIFE